QNITIELHKKHNKITIDISLNNDSEHLTKRTAYSSPKDSICDVSFSEKALSDFFDIDLMDGNEIDIKLKDSVVKAHASIDEINALIGDKYTTALDFTFSSSGTSKIVTSKENLTLNINKGFPVSAGKITVNPYFAGVSEDGFNEYVPEFTGCAVTGFRLNNKASDIPRGFEVIESRCIRTTTALNDKVKSGTIPLLVALDDSFNTPFGSEIPVDVSYTLVNSMPKIKAVSSLKGSLNHLVKETAIFEFAINGPAEPKELTRPYFEIFDSKNRNVTDLFMASIEHNGNYILSIRNPDETTYGKTYKVKIWPENTVNHKKGSAIVYSLSVLSVKAAKKVSISASVKGEINVFNTSSAVTVILKGKNISRFNEISCKVLSAKGDDLTDLFVCETDIQKNKIVIRENADNGANPYTLIKNNLDGKKVKIVITCKYGEDNKSLSVSKTVSVKRKSVTVKPSAAKVSLNPLTDRGYTFNYRLNGCNTRVFADCTLSYKKKVLDTRTSLLTDNFGSYEFAFSEIEDVSRYYGKTLDLKITLHLDKDHTQRSFKELKSITCKITVLNPLKSKVSFTSSSKGSINNVNDNSFATISFKGKNTKASPVVLIDDTEVYRVNGKKKKISYTACFIYALEDGKVIIKRNPFYGNYLATGAYKVDLKLSYDTYDGLKYCKSTASIKVTKGSCSYSFDKKTPELINNNTKRDTFYISNKNEATNVIVYVKVAEKSSIFDLMYLGDGKCSIGFTGGKHLEKKKDKKSPITSAVTKSVKLYVYNDGSNKPTLVTLKVKIYP
nr:hypothetical protein [Butyrivibrio sp.]